MIGIEDPQGHFKLVSMYDVHKSYLREKFLDHFGVRWRLRFLG